MPELPEVETVRRGLAEWVVGRTIDRVEVLHPRAVRRHPAGAADFAAALAGRMVLAARRRGKYLWLVLDVDRPRGAGAVGSTVVGLSSASGLTSAPGLTPPPDLTSAGDAIVCHLGMSGQMLIRDQAAPDGPHLRIRFQFADGGAQLRFVDQRTFGGLSLSPVGDELPVEIAHIARDPFDEAFDLAQCATALRSRRSGVKRALLDQTLISGVGNIYADEALWRARLHGERPCGALSAKAARELLGHVTTVMREALDVGGTSFDALYVNVNGESGYFDRSLAAYGQEGRPCPRCGTAIRREPFMNRSSFSCPRCQPRPRPRSRVGTTSPARTRVAPAPRSVVRAGEPARSTR